jgi:DNA-binding PadR family transcriptional regulator
MPDEHPHEHIILGLLVATDMHGYEIYQSLSHDLSHAWYVGLSQVYALLKRLEHHGKVTSELQPQENRPARKVYCITPEGRRAFHNWVYAPVTRIRDLRLEFLTKLFFICYLALPDAEGLLSSQATVCRNRLRGLQAQLHRTENPFDRLVCHFRISQIESIINWLDHTRRNGICSHVSQDL